jgi:hypothetical protein
VQRRRRFEQLAAEVLQLPQPGGGHGEPAPAAGGPDGTVLGLVVANDGRLALAPTSWSRRELLAAGSAVLLTPLAGVGARASTTPGRDADPPLSVDVEATERLDDAMQHQAQLATLMGQLVWDASRRRDHTTAIGYYDQAISAASQAGETTAEGHARLRKSYVALYGEQDPRAGLRPRPLACWRRPFPNG